MYAKVVVQCDVSMATRLVVWRFGWETDFWAGRLAATRAGSGAANMVVGMVVRRDGSNLVSLFGCRVGCDVDCWAEDSNKGGMSAG